MRIHLCLVAFALALGACGEGTQAPAAPSAEEVAAAAAAEAAAAEKAAAEAAAAAEAERARLAAANAPMADEATWVAACGATGLDASVCACVGKQTMKTLGAKGLFTWVWEGYVNRDGMAQMRSRKWFADNGVDTKAQQAFADAVGTCYVTQ